MFCFTLQMLENICSIILLSIRFLALPFTQPTFDAIYRRFSAWEFLKSFFGGWTFASFVLKYNSKYPLSILTALHFSVFHFITLRQKQNVWLRVLRAIIYALFRETSILGLCHGLFESFGIFLDQWRFCPLWAHSKYKTSKWKTNTSFKGK